MESDSSEIDYEAELAKQPLWFRIQWRIRDWRRQRYLKRLYANPELAREHPRTAEG